MSLLGFRVQVHRRNPGTDSDNNGRLTVQLPQALQRSWDTDSIATGVLRTTVQNLETHYDFKAT